MGGARIQRARQPLQSRKLGAAGFFWWGWWGQCRQWKWGSQNSCSSVFCVGIQSSKVKKTAVKTVANVYSTVIVKVFYVLFKYHAEKDAQRSWCQNTTLFYTVDDGEGSRELTWLRWPLCSRVTMLRNVVGKAKALHDQSQSFSPHCVKRFGQVHKCYTQSFILLSAVLLELSDDEHQICGAPAFYRQDVHFDLLVWALPVPI